MFIHITKKSFSNLPFRLFLFISLLIICIIISQNRILNTKINPNYTTAERLLTEEINQHLLLFTDSKPIRFNKTLETTIQCTGSLYNQSCLYKNLYYFDSTFVVLTVNGTHLPIYSVRTDAFYRWPTTPRRGEFHSYSDLEQFVRLIIDVRVIPSVTLYFGQPWHYNIGHALFDGLYSAYVALIRFPPRHLQPFRILAGISDCNDCWSEDVYSRFGGLGLLKQRVLNQMSKKRWFMFDELVMGSGTFCQRCTQPNLQLAGGVELDASRLFRDRMYQQHGLLHSTIRQKSSAEGRSAHDVLVAYIIDNKRFTAKDRKEINAAINEINNYTNDTLKSEWPLINITYLYYNHVKMENISSIPINATAIDSRSPTYELVDNNFIAQLKLLHRMDIHVSGPGTGQMYQTFLSDGSVNINLGGIKPRGLEKTQQAYTSYLEQHMTSGAPYIKGLYYPINERTKGIKKDQVVNLIRQAAQLILQGFSLPVNPRENLAAAGQLFVEMCEKDEKFCSSVTARSPDTVWDCLELWVEDFVHEHRQWSLKGFVANNRSIRCPFDHSLLKELRKKYGIKHYSDEKFFDGEIANKK